MKPTRPLLRYFGGKFQLRNWIVDHLPDHQFYAEPFAGAASVLMAKDPAPRGEMLNDLNKDLINLYRVMQTPKLAEELDRRLEWTPYAQAELDYANQAWPRDMVEKARIMLVRSFMGIEVSGMAPNSDGSPKKTSLRMGNVSLENYDAEGKRTFRNCAKDWNNWKDALPAIRERLSEVMVYEKDALEFIRLMDTEECLLYIDPPYHHSIRSNARYEHEFTGHKALVKTLLKCKSKVVLSGYECEEYEILEDVGWRVVRKQSRANMSLTPRTEVLWIKD